MSEIVEQLLAKRYCSPAFAFLPQCRNGTGYTKVTRTADAIAMSLYPSRGLDLIGFEFKARRGDWLNELRNPAKAESISQHCHYWYLAVENDTVAKVDEVPSRWGFIVVRKGRLVTVRVAPYNKKAKAPDYAFLGAILRNAQGRTPSTPLSATTLFFGMPNLRAESFFLSPVFGSRFTAIARRAKLPIKTKASSFQCSSLSESGSRSSRFA